MVMLRDAYSTSTFGSTDTGDRVIPTVDPIVQVRRKRAETMLRIDLGALVYAYSIPDRLAKNSERPMSE
jgi:hypothetical protein